MKLPDSVIKGCQAYGRGLIAAETTLVAAAAMAGLTGSLDLTSPVVLKAQGAALVGAAAKYTRDYFRAGAGFGKNEVTDDDGFDPADLTEIGGQEVNQGAVPVPPPYVPPAA